MTKNKKYFFINLVLSALYALLTTISFSSANIEVLIHIMTYFKTNFNLTLQAVFVLFVTNSGQIF